jgi:succinate dehydrogenase flavin-adding protein (antitoxin of CptAB toxin-antitoxin module)
LKKQNIKTLKHLLSLSDNDCFKHLSKKYKWTTNYEDILLYKDTGAPILVVAHVDTVFGKSQFPKVVNLSKDTLIFSPHCDDRVGVFVVLEMLKDIHVDILLTTGEEQANSSAQYAHNVITHDYNWIVEFDRLGSDVVMYEYEDCTDLESDLEKHFKIGVGSYSDICELEFLETGCFNVGVGYYNQHTEQCFVSLSTLTRQIQVFKHFYKKFQSKKYHYEPYIWYQDNEQDNDLWAYIHKQGSIRSWSDLDEYECMDSDQSEKDRFYDYNAIEEVMKQF